MKDAFKSYYGINDEPEQTGPDFNEQGKTDKQRSDSYKIFCSMAIILAVFVIFGLIYYAGVHYGWITEKF